MYAKVPHLLLLICRTAYVLSEAFTEQAQDEVKRVDTSCSDNAHSAKDAWAIRAERVLGYLRG